MGSKIRNRAKWVFLPGILLICSHAAAQVVIEEQLELTPRVQTVASPAADMQLFSTFESEFLIPVGVNELLVLKDGILLFDFYKGVGNEQARPDAHPLTIGINRQGDWITAYIDPETWLPAPFSFVGEPNGCGFYHYSADSLNHTTPPNLQLVQNSTVNRYEDTYFDIDPPLTLISGTDQTNPGELRVWNYVQQTPEFLMDMEQRGLISFDLSYLQTNGVLASASLVLFPSSYESFPDTGTFPPFRMGPLTGSWQEESVTWNTAPPVDETELVSVTDSQFDGNRIALTSQIGQGTGWPIQGNRMA